MENRTLGLQHYSSLSDALQLVNMEARIVRFTAQNERGDYNACVLVNGRTYEIRRTKGVLTLISHVSEYRRKTSSASITRLITRYFMIRPTVGE